MNARARLLLTAAFVAVAAAAVVAAFMPWRGAQPAAAEVDFADGPFDFTNNTGQTATDLEVVFAGSQGTISEVMVDSPPECTGGLGTVIIGGREVWVVYSSKCVGDGDTVSITVMTKYAVTVEHVEWTHFSTPIYTATFTVTRTATPTRTRTPTRTLTPTRTPTVTRTPIGGVPATATPTVTLPAAIISATMPHTATQTPTETPLAPSTEGNGDANGDGRTNSIDGALVLQFGAGLIQSLACMGCADADRNGMITSVDAALILQHDAGLINLPSPV